VRSVLFDINVVLDHLADRAPFSDAAAAALQLVAEGRFEGHIAAHTVTTLHFLLRRTLSRAATRRVLTDLLQLLTVVAIDGHALRHALALDWPDFEDAVQAACAEEAGADFIVTRDKKGFRRSPVQSVTPGELLALVA
jgi:predicted nucleic acid-binding protein